MICRFPALFARHHSSSSEYSAHSLVPGPLRQSLGTGGASFHGGHGGRRLLAARACPRLPQEASENRSSVRTQIVLTLFPGLHRFPSEVRAALLIRRGDGMARPLLRGMEGLVSHCREPLAGKRLRAQDSTETFQMCGATTR